MSDFDKEAEREKLREKYEKEEERRKTTEQMSELLLKGATMTNAHCSDCGDPIFRYDGQEFCPTCQKPVDRGTDEAAGDDEGAAAAGAEESGDAGSAAADVNGSASTDGIEVAAPSDDASVRFGGDDAGAAEEPTQADSTADDAGDADPARDDSPETATAAGDAGRVDQTVDPAAEQQIPSVEPSGTGSATAPDVDPDAASETRADGSVGEHLGRARLVLAKTVERHARLAAAADGPRETRTHLETAREAAETLDATTF